MWTITSQIFTSRSEQSCHNDDNDDDVVVTTAAFKSSKRRRSLFYWPRMTGFRLQSKKWRWSPQPQKDFFFKKRTEKFWKLLKMAANLSPLLPGENQKLDWFLRWPNLSVGCCLIKSAIATCEQMRLGCSSLYRFKIFCSLAVADYFLCTPCIPGLSGNLALCRPGELVHHKFF